MTKGWKCYADNDPGTSGGWPPFIEVYFTELFQESNEKYVLKLDKWIVNNSATPELVWQGYALYPFNSGDSYER